MIAEAIVDAYDEQQVTFLTMLEEPLEMPFEVQILGTPAKVERIDVIDARYRIAIGSRGDQTVNPCPNLCEPNPHTAFDRALGK